MAKHKYGMQKPVQNDLQQCINSFERMKRGGIGIADELVCDTCKRALKYIDELEVKLADTKSIVHCGNCKYLEITGCYGECGKGYLGIVRPECYCCYGERRE